jgi:hypothetical protein
VTGPLGGSWQQGRIGAVRSNPCTLVFWSTHSAIAASGGFRYDHQASGLAAGANRLPELGRLPILGLLEVGVGGQRHVAVGVPGAA